MYICDEIQEQVRNAMYLSIMSDESTDTSVSEQLLVYIRYVDVQSEEIVTRFLGICKIDGHANADNLYTAVHQLITQHHVPKDFYSMFNSSWCKCNVFC